MQRTLWDQPVVQLQKQYLLMFRLIMYLRKKRVASQSSWTFSAKLCDILFCSDQEVSGLWRLLVVQCFSWRWVLVPRQASGLAADSSSLWGNELYEPRRLSHIYYGNLSRKSWRALLGLHASFQPTCAVSRSSETPYETSPLKLFSVRCLALQLKKLLRVWSCQKLQINIIWLLFHFSLSQWNAGRIRS